MTKRRVVVTGIGAVTPLGLTIEDSWQAALAGQSGIARTTCEGIEGNASQISGNIKNFDPTPYVPAKLIRKADLFIQYGIAAAKQAITNSQLEVTAKNGHRIGVAFGSGIGGLPLIEECYDTLLEKGVRKVTPSFIPGAIINMVAGHISIEYGMKGPNIAIVTACTTGTHNIGMAARSIAYGDADVMITGGAEKASSKLGMVGFSAMRALSTRNDAPEKASRPWDKDRDGFVLADGGAALVLEEYEHAKKRGAPIYAEVAGYGMSADAYHMTMPDGKGAALAMQNALHDAGFSPDKVNYINAHGTSTPAGDEMELIAIKEVFGRHAAKLAISSTKSVTGHMIGAAGAIEAIFSILAMRDNIAPPTINLENPSDECKGLNLVPNKAQPMEINTSLSNSFGFGGTNGCLIFTKLPT